MKGITEMRTTQQLRGEGFFDLSGVKLTNVTLGIPVVPFAVGILIGVVSGYFILCLIVSIVAGIALRRSLLAQPGAVELPSPIPGVICSTVLLTRCPHGLMASIDEWVGKNRCVVIGGKSNMPRMAFAAYVRSQLGVCSFTNDGTLSLSHRAVDIGVKLLSFESLSALENAVTTLKQRGWLVDGGFSEQRGLLTSTFTQRMVCEAVDRIEKRG